MLPPTLGGRLTHRGWSRALGARAPDRRRRCAGSARSVAMVATDLFAFGDDVPAAYVEFVDTMLVGDAVRGGGGVLPELQRRSTSSTPSRRSSRVPTAIICGTADKLTSIGHSRKLHARIAGSTLLECEGAGHMVILERHDQVNAELDQLLAAAAATGRRRPR